MKKIKEKLLKKWSESILTEEDFKRLSQVPIHPNSAGIDPWGLDLETVKPTLAAMKWLYTHYFRVSTTGIENVPQGRVLLIANHSGQLPIDGILLGLSLLLEGHPPRIARSMVERWVPSIPFISELFTRIGQVIGDPKVCQDLLKNEEAVLVFPEGLRGIGKSYFEKYQLKRFGTGFVRLALETQTPIVPVGLIGCEEAYPAIYKLEKIGKWINAPYIPITPFFPFLGPLGLLPLPTKVTIRFGQPLYFKGDADMNDQEVDKRVEQVRRAIQKELEIGLKHREDHIFTKAAKEENQ
ncbi:MAG: glycerol acyltransferase [Bdellovibrionaceae bacterium]|nr:glycerol acyltransferase [Pseudobdellovibrionaceae bacterium]